MVAKQIRARGILDERVLTAMRQVPRHLFVDSALRPQAYDDYPLPITGGQTISQPYIVACMTELLQLRGDETVLEIGTGSGYQAAVLSRLCHQVYSVERLNSLLPQARKIFDSLSYFNITAKLADGTLGWPEAAPFDAIIVTAGGPEIPPPLLDQLADPGRLVMPVGKQEQQELCLVTKKGGETRTEILAGVRFVDLIGIHGWKN
ncbi:MAG: protein-L-isoaspartate(D-aspartate) O-methyltransferase [Desulfobulbaceae bacterium]|jgi:protein-L-isoaspartate(D-aspartate) O-methyltransferase|nr:protein-L-isoaspartate(D-aspartate) O-methyltransferase [Desulfobulbaceae bacterium]